MRRNGWSIGLAAVLLLGVWQSSFGVQATAQRKTYSAGQIFTAADYNLDLSWAVTNFNAVIAIVGGDSVETKTAAVDTLTDNTIGKIVLQVPLIAQAPADSIGIENGRIDTVAADTATVTALNAQRGRVDTLAVDSLTVAPGSKAAFAHGKVDTAVVDTLYVSGSGIVSDSLGISLNAPKGLLHVQRSATSFTPNSVYNELIIEDAGDGNQAGAGLQIIANASTGVSSILLGDADDPTIGSIRYQHNLDRYVIRVKGTDATTIDSAGNFILTNSPSPNVITSGPTGSYGGIIPYESTTGETRLTAGVNGAAAVSFWTANDTLNLSHGTERARINATGMGVGETTPAARLDVYSNEATSNPLIEGHQDNPSATGPALKLTNDGSGGLIALNAQTLAVVISDAGTASSTEAGWIEVKTTGGAVIGYARLYSSK